MYVYTQKTSQTLDPATLLGGEAEDLISACPCLSICFFFVFHFCFFFWPKQDCLIKHFPSLTGHMTVYPWELSHEVERGRWGGSRRGNSNSWTGVADCGKMSLLCRCFCPYLGLHVSQEKTADKKTIIQRCR